MELCKLVFFYIVFILHWYNKLPNLKLIRAIAIVMTTDQIAKLTF